MPAKGGPFGSSGRIPGSRGSGTARHVGGGKWVSNKPKGIYKAQKSQNVSASTYKTVDANRSAAAKKAAATRKANAAAAARAAAKSNKAKGVVGGLAAGAAAGYASGYVGRGSGGPKKSSSVSRPTGKGGRGASGRKRK